MLLRVLEHVHGHLGWLAVAALLHPAIILRDPKRRARLSVTLATALVVTTASLGAWIYPDYRVQLKKRIFIESASVGWMFERKEHLAIAAVAFALVGFISHFFLPTKRTAHVAFILAFVFALAVACIGVGVASFKSF